MLEVGMKVVCVDDSAGFASNERTLIKGNIYDVLDLNFGGKEIFVNDLTNKSWSSSRFRPLEDWELEDISELTEVLKNTRLTPTTYQIID